jgi:anti-anti-sigma factor
MQHEHQGNRARFAPTGALTIYEAPFLKAGLLQALAAGGELTVDLGGVEEMDTAGLQLLLLARREAQRANRPLRIASPSPGCREVLARYGLAHLAEDTMHQDTHGSTAP